MAEGNTRLFAERVRLATLRELGSLGFGHIGGCMSILETIALLYNEVLHVDPQNPGMEERDRLVCSKGHAGPVIYAALALKGFFPEEMLYTLNRGGSHLPSHCDRNLTPGIDMTTGSLGQGISAAIGIALGCRLAGWKNYTYLIMGDGECNEGQVWEGALLAPQLGLNRLIGFVDYNKQQLDDYTDRIIALGDMAEKFRQFGWNAIDADGQDIDSIRAAIAAAKESLDKPSMIILHTCKGNGVRFAENIVGNHHMNFDRQTMDAEIERVRLDVEARSKEAGHAV